MKKIILTFSIIILLSACGDGYRDLKCIPLDAIPLDGYPCKPDKCYGFIYGYHWAQLNGITNETDIECLTFAGGDEYTLGCMEYVKRYEAYMRIREKSGLPRLPRM